MSSLQQALKDRRAETTVETAPLCVAVGASTPALVVNLFSGKRWAFPWSYFVCVEYEKDAAVDRLIIRFTHYEILLEGRHLVGLVDDVAMQRVEHLRELPERFAAGTSTGEPFIDRIQVRPVIAAGGEKEALPLLAGPRS
ncbi:MAG: hypothetical protein ABIZ04_21240 [Opitutus sp.]